MRTWHPISDRLLLARHGLVLLRGGALRWRLETYGLYMPSLPNRRPWWRPNGRALRTLVQHRRAYGEWLLRMHRLQTGGPGAWWQARLGADYAALRAYVERQNRDEPPLPEA
jgi:hypothetical protein